jgi:hypothetical protein
MDNRTSQRSCLACSYLSLGLWLYCGGLDELPERHGMDDKGTSLSYGHRYRLRVGHGYCSGGQAKLAGAYL